ncbi:hypothetical protein A3A84_04010 [Candidatus Collierbacteria bacterium RIFCSPLOWO2_01_FULL_50_23]|uniref:Uncharacterized protein n=2 Tax=Candidatus Collieribacteriota TaxID=1752725 RepID=A0A1F5ES09_9BACT|nr:MAG: hypothetical protein A3D09_03035 [Candidatus Collierbacteria bacterium RIFCSPHIGHO2_02_FULL_49_10]OGD71729.1 MAG: hypothetical protein A2703_03300 [Candidatus Collierbacteria bacterium RIFCSPHIGHO2_01_FULL_50_25]OGD74584.1 MAG: hypothetical protein A3A84_04010 [Candidatus Collierbacteria bacterium RIFCSPLOWO2_01_FULL_50_23]
MAKNERIMPSVAGVGEKIAASKKTVVREQGDTRVIKEDLTIYELQRVPGESDVDYRQRRFEKSLQFIKKQLENEERARRLLPERINAPHEFHLIAAGSDGFPAPFRVQERIAGQTLKTVGDLSSLTEDQKKDLDSLLRASLEIFRKNGHFLDLVGRTEEETKNPVEDIKKYWTPLENSNNIMISPDGTISLVDVRLSRKSLLKGAVKFLLIFSYLYRRKLYSITPPPNSSPLSE